MDVPVISSESKQSFPSLSASVKMAVLLPTFRWNASVKSLIGIMAGMANEEIAVLIADNSDNDEKYDFLKKIRNINPNVMAVRHQKNIGGLQNFMYLHDWCKNTEYSAIIGDDDWVSPDYFLDAYQKIQEKEDFSSVCVGSSLVDFGTHQIGSIDVPSMLGPTPFERFQQWNSEVARVTMYSTSKRKYLNEAIAFLKQSPIQGLTLLEDLWELNRLAYGSHVTEPGPGIFVHYPHHAVNGSRFYDLLCKPYGLSMPMLYFMGLSTAIQCGLFLAGKYSPLTGIEEKKKCSQYVFQHIFKNSFLPKISSDTDCENIVQFLQGRDAALDGYYNYCDPSAAEDIIFDDALITWFVEIVKVFESQDNLQGQLMSEQILEFVHDCIM
jgi:hypothetical protein